MEELKSQLAANRSEAGFQSDDGVFGALEGMLARSSARLDSLTNASPMDGVASALNNNISSSTTAPAPLCRCWTTW